MAEEEQPIESQGEAKYGLTYDGSLSSRIEMMVNNKLLSDIIFIVGPEKQRIYAHKLHLVTASEYFHALFYGSFAEAQLDEIELKDEDPEIFLTILRLIYGANVEINSGNIRAVNDQMRMYLLPVEYYKPLIDFLKHQIVDKDSALKIFRENHHYQFEHVDEVCLPYIQSNPLYYFRKDDFTKIEEEVMLKIVGLHHINCTDEQLLFALETCEFTNGKYDKKELRKLVSGRARKKFSHKLPIICNMVRWCDVNTGNAEFSLKQTSVESVSLYGLSVYIVPTNGDVSVQLYLRDFDGVFNEICNLNFVKRCTPYLEIVDLMFEEIKLLQNKTCTFRLILQNSKGYICFSGENPTIVHDNITVTYSYNLRTSNHACAHFWIKSPECTFRADQEPISCCHLKKN